MSLYINGNFISSGTQPIARNLNRTLNYLGNTNWPAYPPSNADFDDIKIWNRALTAQQVLTDYNFAKSYMYKL
jgi:hypothetical protein